MFVGNKNFPGSWGRNFVGSKFYFVNKCYTNTCMHVREDVNLWAMVTHKSHEHWFPKNNDDSTVSHSSIEQLYKLTH